MRQALATLPPGFQEEVVFSGYAEPTALRFTNDGKVFVAEKQGRVWLHESVKHAGSPSLVVDLRTRVHNFWDRGLLGLAVDPQFPERPFLYVLYTLDANSETPDPPAWGTVDGASDDCPNPPGATGLGCVVNAQLSRIEVDPETWQGIESPLLNGSWCQQFPSHSVGDLAFGESGALYVSAGDGANFNQADWGQSGNNPCADPTDEGGALRSQDLVSSADQLSFSGSVIRVDVSGSEAQPAQGNPRQATSTGSDAYVVAIGLRNPFRIATRPGTDELWIGDVGWTTAEEINVVDSLAEVSNFGWPCYEGNGALGAYESTALCQRVYTDVPAGLPTRSPWYSYRRNSFVLETDGCGTGSSSITGLAFNSAAGYPESYANALFFSDSTRRCIWSIPAGSDGTLDPEARTWFARTTGRAVDLQQGPDGFLYYADFDGGNIYRYAYYPTNSPPRARVQPSVSSGMTPFSVVFDASSSTDDEDGANLTFAWDLNDDGVFDDGTGPRVSHVFDAPGLHQVWVAVTDSQQLTSRAVITISADNTAPIPEILSPLAADRWSVDDLVTLHGRATDAESGPIPDANLSWNITMRHCDNQDHCHSHPIMTLIGATATFTAPAHEYPSYLRVELVAVDDGGPDWALPGWVRRCELTVVGDYESAEVVEDVPVLIHLQPSRFDYSVAAPLGVDLRFVDESGQLLEHEVENWSPGGASAIWVKMRGLSSASGQRVYLYYGNLEAPQVAPSPNVWSNEYVGVWHLNDGLADAVTRVSGVNYGAVQAPGRFGAALAFDGEETFAVLREAVTLDTSLTAEAWVLQGAVVRNTADNILSTKSNWSAAEGFNLEVNFATSTIASLGGGRDFLKSTSLTVSPEWHHLVSAMDGGEGRLYFDGVDVTSDGTLGQVRSSPLSLHLGRQAGGNQFLMGSVDEVRLSATARSPAWIRAQYLAATDELFRFGPTEATQRLTGSTTFEFYPATRDVSFDTVPSGLTLNVNGVGKTTPFIETAISGATLSLSAPEEQAYQGAVYEFGAWSDFPERARAVVVNEDSLEFVARYSMTPETCTEGCDSDTDPSTNATDSTCMGDCAGCAGCTSDEVPTSTATSTAHSTVSPSSSATSDLPTSGGLEHFTSSDASEASTQPVSGGDTSPHVHVSSTDDGRDNVTSSDVVVSSQEHGSTPPASSSQTSHVTEASPPDAPDDAGAPPLSSSPNDASLAPSSDSNIDGAKDADATSGTGPSTTESSSVARRDASTLPPTVNDGGGTSENDTPNESGCGCKVGTPNRPSRGGLGALLLLVGQVFWLRHRRHPGCKNSLRHRAGSSGRLG